MVFLVHGWLIMAVFFVNDVLARDFDLDGRPDLALSFGPQLAVSYQ